MKRIFLAVSLLWLAIGVFAAPNVQTQTRLILSASSVKAGDSLLAGIEMKMPAHWHTYWRNGGDAGVPTTIEWTLPSGIKAGEVRWPLPEKLISKEGDFSLITYIYRDVVVLLVPLEVSKDLPEGRLELAARVSWQECDETCVMGHSDLKTQLTIGPKTVLSAEAATLEQWRTKIPVFDPSPKASLSWEPQRNTNDAHAFAVEIPTDSKNVTADFYPYSDEKFEVQSPTEQAIDLKAGKVVLHKTVTSTSGQWPGVLRGVLVLNGEAKEVALSFSDQKKAAAGAESVTANQSGTMASFSVLLRMTLLAFLGGLVLNIMPCVLPVISLKVLGLVSDSKKEPGRLLRSGLIYGLGILVSFAILAGISIAIQRAGGVGDWGGAFRNPQFRVIITILITLIALNLFGLFEVTLGGKTMNVAGELSSKQGYPGAFFNGMLATVLATPCTAPFLSAAVVFTFTQPPVVTLWIFLWVGLGLAFPFVLICWKPWLLKFLPKPGVWMERFKVAMGFPMLITAVWLFSLTSTRLGKDGVLWFGMFLVLLAFVTWMWGQFVQRSSKNKWISVLASVLLLVFGYQYILEHKLNWRGSASVSKSAEKINWRPWSKEAVETARKEGHPVLVDFTADSCLNCQFNKLTSLEIAATRAKLKELGVVAFIADYTDENPAISKELAHYQRAGVPLVVIFPAKPDAEPVVLPPLLTPAIVMKALESVSGKG